jgi:hypothetical protein
MLISGAGNKRDFAARVIGGTPSIEDIVQKVAELEYLEEIHVYKLQRSSEYPPVAEYIDGVVKGDQDQIDAHIAACQAVKDKYPKVEINESTLATRKADALAEYQLEEYTKSISRLSQYQVALGREEVTEETVVGTRPVLDENDEVVLGSEGQVTCEDVVEQIVTVTSIDPVDATIEQTTYDDEGVATTATVENPLITKDNDERADAQAIVDATPQSVIDTYNE